VTAVGLAVQQGVGGLFGGEGERGEGIHYQVHPQHLNGLEWRFLCGRTHSRANQRNYNKNKK